MPMLTVSTKGWVVIPVEFRRKYELEPGARVMLVDYGGVLALVPTLERLLTRPTACWRASLHWRGPCVWNGPGTKPVKAKPARYVLDSFAILAYLQKEPGGRRVAEVLALARRKQADVCLCVVNYGEVVYIIERELGLTDAQTAVAAIDQLPIRLIDADRGLTLAAAHLKAHFAIAYADAFALALAQQQKSTLLTGDPEFRPLERLLSIEWLPQA